MLQICNISAAIECQWSLDPAATQTSRHEAQRTIATDRSFRSAGHCGGAAPLIIYGPAGAGFVRAAALPQLQQLKRRITRVGFGSSTGPQYYQALLVGQRMSLQPRVRGFVDWLSGARRRESGCLGLQVICMVEPALNPCYAIPVNVRSYLQRQWKQTRPRAPPTSSPSSPWIVDNHRIFLMIRSGAHIALANGVAPQVEAEVSTSTAP
jgi:hypothetical protein